MQLPFQAVECYLSNVIPHQGMVENDVWKVQRKEGRKEGREGGMNE